MLEAMRVQSELRLAFIRLGINEKLALDLAADALDLFLRSKLATDKAQQEYAALPMDRGQV